jgi:hypothetical protein
MKAESTFWCACVITMLLVPNATLAEIVHDGGFQNMSGYGDTGATSSWTSTQVYALAYPAEPYSSVTWGGWETYITTQSGYFGWSYEVYASGYAAVQLGAPSSTIWAAGGGTANGPSDNASADAYVISAGESGFHEDGDDAPGSYGWIGAFFFAAYTGVRADHTAYAATAATTPTGGSGYGWGSATAYCDMW